MPKALSNTLISKVETLAHSLNLALYDMFWCKENEEHILRVLVVKELNKDNKRESVSVDECARFSNALSPMLDVELDEEDSYILEVGSAGLERILKTKRHFDLSLFDEILVRKIDKEEVCGILHTINEQGITLKTKHNALVFIAFSDIKKAKSVFEF